MGRRGGTLALILELEVCVLVIGYRSPLLP